MININNYIFEKDLTTKDAGLSRWGLGKRNGKIYFVKEFLWPTYPIDDSLFSNERKIAIISLCKEFENKKIELYRAIHDASDGNLMIVRQFFRENSKYYISTDAVSEPQISLEALSDYSFIERLRICCSIAHSIAALHQRGVVHADIKPSNILLIKRNQHIQARIIDFDCSFFENDNPKPDEPGERLGIDWVYSSPEAHLHIDGEEVSLTCKMDVFSLGLVFHQYLAGCLPEYNKTESTRYVWEAVLENQCLIIDRGIDNSMFSLITRMLQKDPNDRPDMETVFQTSNHLFLSKTGRTMTRVSGRSVPKQAFSHDSPLFKHLNHHAEDGTTINETRGSQERCEVV